ncbi:MAG: TonB-dependent receptor [Acidobacteria bacterium]|nr:TonB-dependent receptor [Acidobacteriota bacterium]
MKIHRILGAILLCMVFLPATARAQGSGITGQVHDTSGGVLPGVTVEVASPALIEGTRTTITNEEGRYRVIDLRPGTYTVTFSLAGFQSLRRDGIALQAEFTATINADLSVGSLEETITVTGAPPVVDVVNVRQQTQITEETLQAIPVNRRMASWAAILPGATTARPADHDVGGIQGERGAFSIHGGPIVDQAVDGMYQVLLGGRTIYSFNTHAIQEVVIETGAGSAESFSGGSVLHYVYKDGGNQFSGTFSATQVTGAMQADNLSEQLRARGLSRQLQQSGGLKESFDVGGGIGGPILRDKLWFFAASRASGTGQYQSGNFYNKTQGSMVYTPDESRPAFTKERFRDITTRLTWQAAEKHRFAGLLSMQKNCTCFYMLLEPAVLTAPEAVGQHTYSPLYIPMVSWTSPFTGKLLFEGAASAQVATNHTKRQVESGVNDISITDIGLNRLYGSRALNLTQTGSYTVNPVRQYHQRLAVSYVSGAHNFRTGITMSEFADPGPGRFTDPNQISQGRSYTFRNGVPESLTLWAVPHGLRGSATNTGIFVQDQWTVDRMTLNLGLRYSRWQGSTPEQVLPAGPFVPERTVQATKNNPLFNNLNPRVGLAYDLFGDGNTAVKVSLGRYTGVEIAPVANPAANMSLSTNRAWTDTNRNYVPDCDLRNPAAQGECGPWSDLGFGQARAVTTRYADDALGGLNKQSYNWQGSASVQHQLLQGLGLNVGYFRTWYGGFLATDNLAVTPADYDPYCIRTPTDSRLPTSGEQLCGFYDLRPAKFGLVDNLVTQASHYGDQKQIYNGVDATLNGRFLDGGQFQGGISVGRTETENCFVVDSPEVAREGFCKVVPPWSAGTQVKFLVVYPLPWSLRTSLVYQNNPGIPYTASHVVSNADVALSLGRNLAGAARSVTKELIPNQTFFEPRLQQIDVRLSRIFRAGTSRFTANVDLYNVFNEDAVLQENTRFGDTWREVSLVMGGRMLRFTGQFDF